MKRLSIEMVHVLVNRSLEWLAPSSSCRPGCVFSRASAPHGRSIEVLVLARKGVLLEQLHSSQAAGQMPCCGMCSSMPLLRFAAQQMSSQCCRALSLSSKIQTGTLSACRCPST